MRYILIVILICFLGSCKREISVDIPDKTPQLVVNSEISADSLMVINLSLTQNITDNSAKPVVPDACIEVFDKDTGFLDVLSYTSGGDYVAGSLKSKATTTYIFRLSRGGTSYWVSQRIPDTVKCSMDTSRIIFQGKSGFFQVELKLDDPPRENFYGLRVKRVYETYQGADTTRQEEWVVLESIDFILTENPKAKFSKQNLMFTDQYFNGVQNQSLKFGASGLFSNQGQNTRMLVVYTTSYTQEGYDYYTSLNEHLFYQNDPFSQPTLVRGNIPGAYGAVIGKYNRADTVRFK